MVWNKDSEGTEFMEMKGMTMVVYHIVNVLYGWHITVPYEEGRRHCLEKGQDFGRENCKNICLDYINRSACIN